MNPADISPSADEAGEIAAQADGLDAPAHFWQVDDVVLQVLALPAAPGSTLRLGIYNPVSGVRLQEPAGSDSLLITLP